MKKSNLAEKALHPNCEYHTSESLKRRIMAQATLEGAPAEYKTARRGWRLYATSLAATLAVIAGIVFIRSTAVPAYAGRLNPLGKEKLVQTGQRLVDSFVGITPEEAAEKMFKALNTWDEPALKVAFCQYDLDLLAKYYKGCTLISLKPAHKSGKYAGVFVPYKIKFSNGKIKRFRIAIRNDNEWGAWIADGGI